MRSRAAIIFAAALVAPTLAVFAAVVTAQQGTPSEVLGDKLACPNGGQVQSRYSLNGDAWSVTGILTTGLIGSITVAGPSGDVTVTPTVNLVVTGDPQIGQPATMEGTLAMTGEMVATSIANACSPDATVIPSPVPATPGQVEDPEIDQAVGEDENGVCNRGAGQSGELKTHINNGGVHIQRGTVLSFDGANLVVQTPSGTMNVLVNADTHVNGDPSAAVEVKVRGDLEDGGVVVADEVKALCPNPNGDTADGNEGETVDGDDHGGGKDKNKDKESKNHGSGGDEAGNDGQSAGD